MMVLLATREVQHWEVVPTMWCLCRKPRPVKPEHQHNGRAPFKRIASGRTKARYVTDFTIQAHFQECIPSITEVLYKRLSLSHLQWRPKFLFQNYLFYLKTNLSAHQTYPIGQLVTTYCDVNAVGLRGQQRKITHCGRHSCRRIALARDMHATMGRATVFSVVCSEDVPWQRLDTQQWTLRWSWVPMGLDTKNNHAGECQQ
jgi:hypothetical protein